MRKRPLPPWTFCSCFKQITRRSVRTSCISQIPSLCAHTILTLFFHNLVPNEEDGGIIGATLLLKGVHETIVSFADRPYRTMDAIPIGEFFAYPLVDDFFKGSNPPNAIVAGELPADIAAHFSQRDGTSSTLPYRRLLGGVLGEASYDAEKNELRFRLPAGLDVFDADGKTRILQPDVFDEIKKAYAEAGKNFPFTTFRRLIAHTRLTLSFLSLQTRRAQKMTRTFYPCFSK